MWAKNEREREKERESESSLCKVYNVQLVELVHGVSLSNQQKDKSCYQVYLHSGLQTWGREITSLASGPILYVTQEKIVVSTIVL